MADEENTAAKFLPGKRFGDWVIISLIDEGGFGKVYRVENVKSHKFAALKAEPNDVEGGSAIKLEMLALKALASFGEERPHVPTVYHAAKHAKYCYMIMMLLGDNLKKIKINCPKEVISPQSWSRLGIQALYSIKYVHDCGYVHRDIKPNNFVLGHREDAQRARLLHILDFGLARSYASLKNGKWIARRARRTAEFRGTPRYCSPNMHEKKEQGRQDDLISLLYVLIELHGGLPWASMRNKEEVEHLKLHIPNNKLMANFPAELHEVMPPLRKLDCYQRPNYSEFYNGLVAVMKRLNVSPNDPFDWETKEELEGFLKQQKGPAAWEDASEFFKSDPVQVDGPPPLQAKDEPNQSTKNAKEAKSEFPKSESSRPKKVNRSGDDAKESKVQEAKVA